MKITFDSEAFVSKSVELGTKGYDKAKAAAPTAKKNLTSFMGRMKKAAEKGKKAARRK